MVPGVSPATGSGIASNDILAETRYPDPVTGQPSAAERDVNTTNALGERTSFTDRAGTTHTYAYDVTGRQTADTVTALGVGVDGAVRRIDSAYDTLGRLTTVTSRSGVTATSPAVNQVTRAYSGFGQLTSEWQAHTGLVSTTTTPRVQYAYSQGVGGNHSRLTRTTYPSGYAVDYAYTGIDSAVSRPTSLAGQRANTTASATLEAFKYLGAGTVIERSRPEVNVTLSMVNLSGATADAGDKYTGLDRFGRVVDQRWTNGTTATSPVVDRYGYTYDRNSNRLTRTNALAAAYSEWHFYDALDQLQSFSRSGGATRWQDWQFDALGNWTSVTTDWYPANRTANAQNELTHVGGSSLAYSRTGNLTTDAQGRTLAYDAWNRLVSVKNSSGLEIARYEYDGLGRRIVEQVGTLASPWAGSAPVRDVYYSQDWQVLEERLRTSTGAIPATADSRFIWSPVYVDAMIARDRNADNNAATGNGGLEERVYAIQDANWNTTAIIAATGVTGVAAGAVINRFVYTPYGEVQTLSAAWASLPAGSTPAVPWAHLFQGLEFTDVTALAYVRHRDYSASLGRFIEMDPIGFAAGDNNWYRFVANGPTGKTDPSGLFEIDEVTGFPFDEDTGYPVDGWFLPPSSHPQVASASAGRDEYGLPVSGPLRAGSIATATGGSQCDNLPEAKRLAKELVNQTLRDAAINTATAGIPIGAAGKAAGKAAKSAKPSLSAHKEALKKVHREVGKLPKGTPGKFGSPQAGTPKTGYRLDPPHPDAKPGTHETGYHFNWWDWTGGKKATGGRCGAVPVGD
jgi:RHS repeat-associated protein